MRNGILQSDIYYCDHIGASPNDERDINNFIVWSPAGENLKLYLQTYALSDEKLGYMKTYLVRETRSTELVGYFSLKSGLVSYNERDIPDIDKITGKEIIDEKTGEKKMRRVFDILPGTEIANFAVNYSYIKNHPDVKGLGLVIFNNFILPIVEQASKLIGSAFLYIFALPYDELISRYEQYGFFRLEAPLETQLHKRLKPFYDDQCIFMFQPIKQN